jgi:anaerobic selenocysteine-containing dehydrogenase
MPIRTDRRRDFLKTTAATSTVVAGGVSSALGVAASRSPSEKIRLAAIGVTGMGGTRPPRDREAQPHSRHIAV